MASSLRKVKFIRVHDFKDILVHHCGKDLVELMAEKKDGEIAYILADQEAGSVTGISQR